MSTKVQVQTLDEVVERAEIDRLDLIKIDVEGLELDVLEGAKHTILRLQPTVIIEFNSFTLLAYRDISPRKALEMLFKIFDSIYYRVDNEIRRLDQLDGLHHFLHSNLVANGCVDDLICISQPGGLSALKKSPEAHFRDLKEELSQVILEREDLKEELSQVILERENLKEGLSQVSLERDNLKEGLSQLALDHNNLKEELSQVAVDRDDLKEELSQVALERDDLKEELSQVALESNDLKEKLSQVVLERDNLLNSTSWRITKPLRTIRKSLTNLVPKVVR